MKTERVKIGRASSKIKMTCDMNFTLSPTLKLSSFLSVVAVVAADVGVDVVTPGAIKPGLGIFDPAGSVPIPELELVEAAEVGLGR